VRFFHDGSVLKLILFQCDGNCLEVDCIATLHASFKYVAFYLHHFQIIMLSPWCGQTEDFISCTLLKDCCYITNSMKLSPAWEATCCSATQEFRNILWNPEVHYVVHQSCPVVPVMSQMNSVHTTPSYFLTIHLNIILWPMSRSS
jgi:hypothetical protein